MSYRCIAMALAFAAATWPAAGYADSYPSRPIRFMSPYPAGNGGDLSNRFVLDLLSKRLKQSIIVENRPGPNGVVAANATKSADPDGYTLTSIGNVHAIGQSLMQSPPYDVINDFVPIAILGYSDVVMITSEKSQIKTIRDLISRSKESPDQVSIGTAVVGTTQYLTAALFKSQGGVSSPIVPFRTSGDMINAVTRNDVTVAFDLVPAVLPIIQAGKVNAIAISSSKRFPGLPDVPTFRESGEYTTITGWQIIAAPRDTPAPIIRKINSEISKALLDKDAGVKFQKMGYTPAGGTPEYARDFLKSEIAKWKEVIETAKIPRR